MRSQPNQKKFLPYDPELTTLCFAPSPIDTTVEEAVKDTTTAVVADSPVLGEPPLPTGKQCMVLTVLSMFTPIVGEATPMVIDPDTGVPPVSAEPATSHTNEGMPASWAGRPPLSSCLSHHGSHINHHHSHCATTIARRSVPALSNANGASDCSYTSSQWGDHPGGKAVYLLPTSTSGN